MTTIAGTTRTAETKHRAKRQGAKPKALDGGQCTLDLSRFAVSRRPIDRVDGGAVLRAMTRNTITRITAPLQPASELATCYYQNARFTSRDV